MKFTLNADSMAPVQQGIGGIFQALTKAPLIQQQMQDITALRQAQIYNSTMSGNKSGAQAESERYTLGKRKSVPDLIAADPSMPSYLQVAHKVFDLTGDDNMERFAKASGEFQTQGIRDQAVSNVGNIDQMNRLNTLAKPGATYEPFANIGNTGTVFSKATGDGRVASSTLDKLFGAKTNSEISENNAQAGAAGASAGLSNERRKEIQLGKITPGTDESGNPILFRAGTSGDVTVLDDLSPFRKAGGADAAYQKTRGRVVEQVFKDPMVMPEEREAEVERRMTLIGGPKSKGPAAAATATKIDGVPDPAKANDIKAKFKAGKLTRDQAKQQLKALGYE